MLFIGVDLAWSDKNGTGIAVVVDKPRGAKLRTVGIAFSDEEIIDCIKDAAKDEDALIAIDAPLIVPNETGRRVAEELVGKLFRQYDAGAHPANRSRLSSWTGKVRGEEISRLLEKGGFIHSPYLAQNEKARKFFEVYPHPSSVVIFNLERILQYKAKPHRDYDFRWAEFRKYQGHLKSLEKASPKLKLPDEIVSADVAILRSQALKDYEDKLDAIFCAYIAQYAWAWPNECAVLGDMQKGYILTPVFRHMLSRLAEEKSQKALGDYA